MFHNHSGHFSVCYQIKCPKLKVLVKLIKLVPRMNVKKIKIRKKNAKKNRNATEM